MPRSRIVSDVLGSEDLSSNFSNDTGLQNLATAESCVFVVQKFSIYLGGS
jgi:hypothetical protein